MIVRKGIAGAVVGLALGAVSMVSALEIKDVTLWSLDKSMGPYGALQFGYGGGVSYDGDSKLTFPWFGGGGGLFFDATYAEAVVGAYFGDIKPVLNSQKTADSASYVNVDLGLMGKYPFELSNSVTLFPMAGVSYQLCVRYKTDGYYATYPEDFNSRVFINLGAGIDIALGESIFFRPVFTYGIGLATRDESNFVDDNPGSNANFAHDITIRVGLGFKL